MTALAQEIVKQVQCLPLEEQRRVLEFARALASTRPKGIPGKDLLDFAGCIGQDDLARMRRAIAEGCERIDAGAR